MSDLKGPIEEWLKAQKYDLGHYRSCSHYCGIPQMSGVLVKPNWTPVDGDHTLKVTPTEVIQLTVRIPYNSHNWMEMERFPYASLDELKQILDRLVKQPAGCWQ